MDDRLSLYEGIRDKISDYFMKPSNIESSDLMNIFGLSLGDRMLWNLLIKGLFHHLHYIPKNHLNLINGQLSSRISELQHKQIQQRELGRDTMDDRLSLYEGIRDKISDYFMKQSYTESSDLMNIFGSILGDKMLWNLLIKGLFHHLHYIPKNHLNLINEQLLSRISELQHKQIQQREMALEIKNFHNKKKLKLLQSVSRFKTGDKSQSTRVRDTVIAFLSYISGHSYVAKAIFDMVLCFYALPICIRYEKRIKHFLCCPFTDSWNQMDLKNVVCVTFGISLGATLRFTTEDSPIDEWKPHTWAETDIFDVRVIEGIEQILITEGIETKIFQYLDLCSILQCERSCHFFCRVTSNHPECFTNFKYSFCPSNRSYMFRHYQRLYGSNDPFYRFRHSTKMHLSFWSKENYEFRLLTAFGHRFRNVRSLTIEVNRKSPLVDLSQLVKKYSNFFVSIRSVVICVRGLGQPHPNPHNRMITLYKSLISFILIRCSFIRTLTLNYSFLTQCYPYVSSCLELTQILCINSKSQLFNDHKRIEDDDYSNIIIFKMNNSDVVPPQDGADDNKNIKIIFYRRHVLYSFLSYFHNHIRSIHVHNAMGFSNDIESAESSRLNLDTSFGEYEFLEEMCLCNVSNKISAFVNSHCRSCPLLNKMNVIFDSNKNVYNADQLYKTMKVLLFTDEIKKNVSNNSSVQTEETTVYHTLRKMMRKYVNIITLNCDMSSNVKLLSNLEKTFEMIASDMDISSMQEMNTLMVRLNLFVHIHIDVECHNTDEIKKLLQLLKHKYFQCDYTSYLVIARILNGGNSSNQRSGINKEDHHYESKEDHETQSPNQALRFMKKATIHCDDIQWICDCKYAQCSRKYRTPYDAIHDVLKT
eukprot:823879_1